jgi:hypothetical protein
MRYFIAHNDIGGAKLQKVSSGGCFAVYNAAIQVIEVGLRETPPSS